jgi:hypothetical protein
MCFAIIKIDYRNATEQPQLVQVDTPEDLVPKIEEIKNRPEVKKVTWFIKYMSTELVSAWKDTIYEKGNKNSISAGHTLYEADASPVRSAEGK